MMTVMVTVMLPLPVALVVVMNLIWSADPFDLELDVVISASTSSL